MHHIRKFMWPCIRLDKSKKHMLYSKFLHGVVKSVPHQGQVNLVNTCPIDNFLTIFYVLMKTRNKFFQYLLRSPELYAITLIKICEM